MCQIKPKVFLLATILLATTGPTQAKNKDLENCFCPTVYDPVCAKDGKTYQNWCMMECHGKGVKKERNGECEVSRGSCNCPDKYDPSCGEDGKTYDNVCLMACEGKDMRKKGPC